VFISATTGPNQAILQDCRLRRTTYRDCYREIIRSLILRGSPESASSLPWNRQHIGQGAFNYDPRSPGHITTPLSIKLVRQFGNFLPDLYDLESANHAYVPPAGGVEQHNKLSQAVIQHLPGCVADAYNIQAIGILDGHLASSSSLAPLWAEL